MVTRPHEVHIQPVFLRAGLDGLQVLSHAVRVYGQVVALLLPVLLQQLQQLGVALRGSSAFSGACFCGRWKGEYYTIC